MNNNEIVMLNHIDLDALGCLLHLNIATPNNPKVVFNTNYQNLEEKVSEVYEYCFKNNPKLLLITDVSFGQAKDQLLKLRDVMQMCPVILIDHHEYPDNFFDDIKITVIHDITKSATKLTQEFFKTRGKNKNLDLLSNIINSFDIWLAKEPNFELSLSVNDYFWELNNKMSMYHMAIRIENNDFKLPNFKEFYKVNTANIQKKIKGYKDRKLIVSSKNITLCFVDDTFNNILFEEFTKKNTEFVAIINSYGIMRFRFNSYSNLLRKQKEKIKIGLIGTLSIGHLNAFSEKIQNSNFEKIMARAEEVFKIVDGVINK